MNGTSVNRTAPTPREIRELLHWAAESGIDETLEERPVDRFARSAAARRRPAPVAAPAAPAAARARPAAPGTAAVSTAGAVSEAQARARAAGSLAELRDALAGYDGCSLKRTAMNLVFGTGDPAASVMFVGEAPGADEDRTGEPFVGVSGQLLTRMLASIGLERDAVYITNILPWRPPGNREPNPFEREVCLPFIHRHIELVAPQFLVLLGATAANTLLGRSGSIGRMRGRWFAFRGHEGQQPTPALATFHPSYLLRSPERKADAWQDMLAIRRRLDESS